MDGEEERVGMLMRDTLPSEMVTVSNLQKYHHKMTNKKDEVSTQSRVIKALDGISFSVNTNQCFVILGAKGAGKTTLFKCLTFEQSTFSG